MIWPFNRITVKRELITVEHDGVNRVPRLTKQDRYLSMRSKSVRSAFNAGMVDRINHTWTTQAVSADQMIFDNLNLLRARAREQSYNNDYVKRFTGMLKTNVVGPKGITLQSRANRNGKPNRKMQVAIEHAFREWGKRDNCDFKGAMNWVQIQNMVMSTVANDGEIFIRHSASRNKPYQLELIDAEYVDISYCTKLKNGNEIIFGIEYNSVGKVTAYHINLPVDSNMGYLSGYNSKRYERIPASDITHLFLREYIGQRRGLPWTSTGLQRMKLLQGYEDAALVAARIGASKMGFFTGDSESYTGEGTDMDGVPYEEAEPGTFGQLPPGVGFESFDPNYPSGEFSDFMKQALRGISAGLSVSYNTLANDLEGVNFSSMRHGAVEEREIWMVLQEWLIDELVRPVFDEWLERYVEAGIVKVPKGDGNTESLPTDKGQIRGYRPASFQGRRWKWIDPLKDIQSKEKEVALGVTSITAIIQELGGDVDRIREAIESDMEWFKTLDEKGLLKYLTAALMSQSANTESDEEPANEPE